MIKIEENVSLKKYNTFGIEVFAKQFGVFNSVNDLKELHKKMLSTQLLILGGGSNVLFTKNVDKLVLLNSISYIRKIEENKNSILVEVGGGQEWHKFVNHCIDSGWYGVENLSLIPGSVGASPMQNIGAYGVEIKDVFHALEAFHIETAKIHKFDKKKCNFGYRESVFKNTLKNQYIITSVQFKLSKNFIINSSYGVINQKLAEMKINNPTPKDISDAVIQIRQSKLPNPNKIGNAGSFFKNPIISREQFNDLKCKYPSIPYYPTGELKVKLPAAWLIDRAGWKGFKKGRFGVHKNQALVLVNYGGATGNEILKLSSQIIEDIKSKYGITLEREVNVY